MGAEEELTSRRHGLVRHGHALRGSGRSRGVHQAEDVLWLRGHNVDGVLLPELHELGDAQDLEIGVLLLELLDLGVVTLGEYALLIVYQELDVLRVLDGGGNGLHQLGVDVHAADVGLGESVVDAVGAERVVGGDDGDGLRRAPVGHREPVPAIGQIRVSTNRKYARVSSVNTPKATRQAREETHLVAAKRCSRSPALRPSALKPAPMSVAYL